ncbi:uncharacterized protein LOC141686174 [Apium graveolens]|uniref:uncharacterized protein LOC141686174 n=1 Tax=Apium graveolens TaxID=4045 RepID=UPI003D7A6DAB
MFMSAIARPRYSEDGTCTFDGKIGIFPFIIEEPAVRASKNRAWGVIQMKPIESITKTVIKACLLEKIIPSIMAEWPSGCDKHIVVQQDNASPHINDNDLDFVDVAQSDGFNITLANQPANSPDLNINDLGFFRIIQGLQHEKRLKRFVKILKLGGNNNYKLPHIKKGKLARRGQLPNVLTAPLDIVEKALDKAINGQSI